MMPQAKRKQTGELIRRNELLKDAKKAQTIRVPKCSALFKGHHTSTICTGNRGDGGRRRQPDALRSTARPKLGLLKGQLAGTTEA